MKIINYKHGIRCKVGNASGEIRVVFERKEPIFFNLFTCWAPIFKRAYIFHLSNDEHPKDGRPRTPSTTVSINYERYQFEYCFNDFDLKKRIKEIVNEIFDDIKEHNAEVSNSLIQIDKL